MCLVYNSFSLVVVSRFQPSPIVMALLPRLAPSRPFVVYCQYKEVTCPTTALKLFLNHLPFSVIVKFVAFYCCPFCRERRMGAPEFPFSMFVHGIDKVMRHIEDLTLSVRDPGTG